MDSHETWAPAVGRGGKLHTHIVVVTLLLRCVYIMSNRSEISENLRSTNQIRERPHVIHFAMFFLGINVPSKDQCRSLLEFSKRS